FAFSIARQIRPLWMSIGMGAVWYSPSNSKPFLLSVGEVQVCPRSVERRIRKLPWCFQGPIMYNKLLCTNKFDQNCPSISEIFCHDFPLSVEVKTAVSACSCSVVAGPKWSCDAT